MVPAEIMQNGPGAVEREVEPAALRIPVQGVPARVVVAADLIGGEQRQLAAIQRRERQRHGRAAHGALIDGAKAAIHVGRRFVHRVMAVARVPGVADQRAEVIAEPGHSTGWQTGSIQRVLPCGDARANVAPVRKAVAGDLPGGGEPGGIAMAIVTPVRSGRRRWCRGRAHQIVPSGLGRQKVRHEPRHREHHRRRLAGGEGELRR